MNKTTIISFLGSSLVITAIITTVITGINNQEIVECNKWKTQSKEYSQFYLTHWQDEQCRAHGFIIKAPIK